MITEQKIMLCLIISVKWGENEKILCKEILLFLLTAVRQTTAKNGEDEHWNCWIEVTEMWDIAVTKTLWLKMISVLGPTGKNPCCTVYTNNQYGPRLLVSHGSH